MKKMLILAIMVLGLNANVFAEYNMIESIKVHEIACFKNPEEITKKEMKLIKKYGFEWCYQKNLEKNKHLNEKSNSLENNKDLNKKKDGLENDKHLNEKEKDKNPE